MDREVVHFAVELLRREAERVLMMELVGDLPEGGREVSRRRQLEVAAAGRRGDLGQSLVRLFHLQLPSAEAAHATPAGATESAGSDPSAAPLIAASSAHAGHA